MATKNGIVPIKGKDYQTVALRVHKFREKHPIDDGWCIVTHLHSMDSEVVVMKAEIIDPSGRVVGCGYAKEFWSDSGVNSTSALENCETSAIGRALASIGLAGEEYAYSSANETGRAIQTQDQRSAQIANQVPGVKVGAPEIKWSPAFSQFYSEAKQTIKSLPDDMRADLETDAALKKEIANVVVTQARIFRTPQEMAQCDDPDDMQRAASAWMDHIDRLAAFT